MRKHKRMEVVPGEIDSLKAEISKLRAEVERLKGPFTCQHPPEYAGGACAVCHAEWIDKATKLELQLDELQKLVKRVDAFFCNPEIKIGESAAVLVVPGDLAIAVRSVAEKRVEQAPKNEPPKPLVCAWCGDKDQEADVCMRSAYGENICGACIAAREG